MGNEVKCLARIDGKREEGKALLETAELIFRGAASRIRIAFGEIESVAAVGGELRIATKGREFAFVVGPAAEKWREKILHPKTRMEKLGVKAATRVETMGHREESFAKELEECGANLADGKADRKAELIFWFVEREERAAHGARRRQEDHRRSRAVDCLSQGTERDHRERCARRGTQGRTEGREGGAFFADAHGAEICDSGRKALGTRESCVRSRRRTSRSRRWTFQRRPGSAAARTADEFGLTYLFISHSLPVVAQIAARIAEMLRGRVVEVGPARQILGDPSDGYTKELRAAVPAI